MSKVYFVTGASRGLGYEFVLQLLNVSTNHIIAAVRNKETSVELQKLAALHPGRVDLVTMDVASTESVEKGTVETEALAAAKGGVDCVICNAGVLYGGWGTASEGSIADIEANMQINLYGVVRVSQSMLPLLRKGAGKQLVVLSSILGSIGGKTSETPVAATYSISKAAVNMYCMKLARELNPEGFTVIPIHPGYVSTDMNGGRAKAEGDIYQEESIEGMLKVITKATQAENGTFYNYAGENLPW